MAFHPRKHVLLMLPADTAQNPSSPTSFIFCLFCPFIAYLLVSDSILSSTCTSAVAVVRAWGSHHPRLAWAPALEQLWAPELAPPQQLCREGTGLSKGVESRKLLGPSTEELGEVARSLCQSRSFESSRS